MCEFAYMQLLQVGIKLAIYFDEYVDNLRHDIVHILYVLI